MPDKSKTALITGSSAGIGAEIALQLSNCGYDVFLTGRNTERLKNHADKVKAKGFFVGNLEDISVCKELFSTAEKTLGRIDILINNAGEYIWSPVEKTSDESIEKLFKINLQAAYILCKLAVPGMKTRRWGRIINIGSISGSVGEANASLYSASKAGLIGLTKALALELAEYNITTNIINPGWVKTELCDKVFECEILDESEQLDMIPQKRFIHPSEVAAMVKYLVSEEAKGVTGQSLNLCAGLSLG